MILKLIFNNLLNHQRVVEFTILCHKSFSLRLNLLELILLKIYLFQLILSNLDYNYHIFKWLHLYHKLNLPILIKLKFLNTN